MADPKIKYDIEAAVKGASGADELAASLKNVSDVLEGDLKQDALQASQALEALGSKQRVLDTFQQLKRESTDLSAQLTKATSTVDSLSGQLSDVSSSTQMFAVAERKAADALAESQASLVRKRDALKTVREETAQSERRTDAYRATVNGLKDGIKQATAEVSAHRTALRTAAQDTVTAQNAEAGLRKEYDLAIGSAAKLSGSVRATGQALEQTRSSMQQMGVSTSNVAQQQNTLRTAVDQVRAQVSSMAPAYQQAAAASTSSTQVQAQNQRTLREGMTSISTQLANIQKIATIAMGGSWLGTMGMDVARTADAFKNLEARVKLATGEGAGFTTSFAGVKRVALDTNTALTETGTLFARLTKASQEGGMAAEAAQQRALGLTQTINQGLQLSGGSAESANAALTQLIQGLQSGVLRGEEFNSVMEQAPRLAQALSQGLGVTTGELRKMAEAGVLTSETVMRALEGQADVVQKEFEKLPPTVGRALQNLTTQWTLYVGESDKGLLSSANAAKVIDALAGNLDVLVHTLLAAGKVWVGLNIMTWVGQFTRWATTTLTATKALEANTVAAAANAKIQGTATVANAQNTAAQAANTVATQANTAARAANAKAWSEIGLFAKGASVGQDMATAAAAKNTAAIATNAQAVTKAGVVWRATSALFGPWGIAVALLAPEIVKLGEAMGEGAAKAMGYGKAMKEAEDALKLADLIAKEHAETLKRQARALEDVVNRSFDLTKESKSMIAAFDTLTKAGDSSAVAIDKIGKDFDLSNSPGIRNASSVLDKLLADAKITVSEFDKAWADALNGQDLAKFEVMASSAFAAVGTEAKALALQIEKAVASAADPAVIQAMKQQLEGLSAAARRESERMATAMDAALRESVRRSGNSFQDLKGQISATSASAINDVEVIVKGLDRLKEQGIDTGRVLSASLSKAIDTADSK